MAVTPDIFDDGDKPPNTFSYILKTWPTNDVKKVLSESISLFMKSMYGNATSHLYLNLMTFWWEVSSM